MSQTDLKAFTEDTDMKRDLGLLEAVSIVISRIIGSGIFRTPAPIMAAVGCTSLFGLVWVLGGGLTLLGAFTYAELGAMFPRAGGDYQFLKEAYGPPAGFALGWISFWIISPGSVAALSIALVSYLPGLSFAEGSAWSKFAAVIAVAALTANSAKPR